MQVSLLLCAKSGSFYSSTIIYDIGVVENNYGKSNFRTRFIMNKFMICIFALFLVSCQSTQFRPITTIDALQITDSSGPAPYVAVVSAGATSSRSLPLPEYDIHIASLPSSAKWMGSYNFDNNNSLSRAEITHAWLVQIAIWKTGKPYSPSALSINSPV